jgi:hypothetical protein
MRLNLFDRRNGRLGVLTLASLFFSLSSGPLHARVKLVALPERERTLVALTENHGGWVQEERHVPLQKGVNKIDFSWRGVSIDPSSIRIRLIDAPANSAVLNTSFPPNENALIWEVACESPAEARIRISYLVQGLHQEFLYKATADPKEESLGIRSILRLRNDSGEELANSEFLLNHGGRFTNAVAFGETLEIQTEKIPVVPMKKILTWDAAQQPWDPEYEKNTVGLPLSYVLTNGRPSNLGEHSIPAGKARIFIRGDAKGTSGENVTFLGEDWAAATPTDRDLKLSIGQSRDVKVTQRAVKQDRVNIRRNRDQHEVVWDLDETLELEIENFKKDAAELVIVEHIPGYWKLLSSSHPVERTDAFTLECRLRLPAESRGDKRTKVTLQLQRLNVQGNEITSY